jgi:hypothetical protein
MSQRRARILTQNVVALISAVASGREDILFPQTLKIGLYHSSLSHSFSCFPPNFLLLFHLLALLSLIWVFFGFFFLHVPAGRPLQTSGFSTGLCMCVFFVFSKTEIFSTCLLPSPNKKLLGKDLCELTDRYFQQPNFVRMSTGNSVNSLSCIFIVNMSEKETGEEGRREEGRMKRGGTRGRALRDSEGGPGGRREGEGGGGGSEGTGGGGLMSV